MISSASAATQAPIRGNTRSEASGASSQFALIPPGASNDVSNVRKVVLASGSSLVLLAAVGCSPSATKRRTEIGGMTPAEYREKQEQALGSPPDGSPKATAKPGRKTR